MLFLQGFSVTWEFCDWLSMRIKMLAWVFLIPFVVNLFGVDMVLVFGQCQSDQQSWLLQLNSSLVYNANQSVHLRSWDRNTDCCRWSGVECDRDGYVVGLNLSSESISGGIENLTGLFNLQHLERLNLAFNQFSTSPIPFGLGNLANLTHLNLSFAGFIGQVPVEISRMTKLVVLDLSSRYFLGSPSLKLENPNLKMLVQNLSELRQLYLDGVNISAQRSDWCQALSSSLPKLQTLSLSSCFLSGPIHSSLAGLQSLSEIRLDQNNLSSPVPEFLAELKNLTILCLSSSNLVGTFPAKILQIPSLQRLELTQNELLGGTLSEFHPNMSLQILMLRDTNFSGKLPTSLGNLKNLSTLELTGCNFTGQIPASIMKLAQLVHVDLSANKFTGPVPSLDMSKNLRYLDLSRNDLKGNISSIDWHLLENLVNLNLGYNSLGGNIPPSLFQLPLLEKLQLDNNQFNGTLPNAFSSALDIIDLSGNMLEGPIPASVFDLKRLNLLVLSSNKFNDTISLEAIGKLQNLTRLDLSYNRLTVHVNSGKLFSLPQFNTLRLASCRLGVFPDLQNQTKLFDLDLSDNLISGEIPKWIWNVSGEDLIYLNLSHNTLRGLQEPYRIPALGILDLHSNQLQGNIPLPPVSASYMDFSYNKLTSAIPASIGDSLSGAVFFSLSNNRLTGEIPDSICNATSLSVLDLSYNNLSGEVPKCLMERVQTLGVLNLRGNNLAGAISDTFSKECGLQTLDLNGNHLEGRIPKSLANCSTLEVLDLGNNQIHDMFPCWFKTVSSLRVLVLRSNKFYGSIDCSKFNGSWPMLQIVDIAANNFNGRLPSKSFSNWKAMMVDEDEAPTNYTHLRYEFLSLSRLYYHDGITITIKGLEWKLVRILTLLTSIDLSCNNFEGPIPEEIGEFKLLYVLNLSHNALTGSIPSIVGILRQLESLDLSMNRLTGSIPQQITDLTFLSFLNLSYNFFVGRIPSGTQIQTFSASSFQGNEGLCGPPLNNCSNSSPTESPALSSPTSTAVDWEFILIGIGFGVGSAVIIAPIMFSKTVNKWSDTYIDKILLYLLPMIGFVYTTSHQRKIHAEELLDNETTDEDDSSSDDWESEQETEECKGNYCVFCSKLDITMKKVIHDTSCTCHESPPISSSSSTSTSSSSLANFDQT